jgi:GNAT superfamily N-acetyltransferase
VIHQRVDEYWAAVFGCPVERLWAPGCSVSAYDMPGAYVLVHGDSCRIATPAAWVPMLAHASRDLSAGDALDRRRWSELLPRITAIHGPSVHAYLDSVAELPDPGDVIEVNGDALTDLRSACPPAEWAEGGFGDTGRFFALHKAGTLVAAGNLTEWRGVPSDIGLVTHPDHRGRGYGLLVGALAARVAIAESGIARYRVLADNLASRRIARRLGFVEYGSNLMIRLVDAAPPRQ